MAEHVCAFCNIPFTVPKQSYKQKYCSEICRNKAIKERSNQFKRNRELIGTKQCSKCREIKALTDYTSSTHMYCKSCNASWRREKRKQTYSKEAEAAKNRKGKDYKSYLSANFPQMRCRAKLKNLSFSITKEDLIILAENQNFLCALTGEPLTFIVGAGRLLTNASVDRIDSTLGYTKDNIQLVSLQVNILKNTLSMTQLYQLCETILRYKACHVNLGRTSL